MAFRWATPPEATWSPPCHRPGHPRCLAGGRACRGPMRCTGQCDRVREQQAGHRSAGLAGPRVRRRGHPGLRHVDEHQRRRDGQLQDQDVGLELPHRHPPPGLLPGPRRAQDRHDQLADVAHAADVPDGTGHRAGRLRQLGRLGLVGRAQHRRLGRLHRAPRAQRHRRRQPDPVRRAQRREPFQDPAADLRRDLAGLQHLRRKQPLQVLRRLPARRSARLQGRLRGLL